MPAGCGHDAVPAVLVQLVPGAAGQWAHRELLKRMPADPVESLAMIVLLMMLTADRVLQRNTSTIPAGKTLLAMMLLVTFTEFQRPGLLGKNVKSVPLTPVEPDGAAGCRCLRSLLMNRLALITMLGTRTIARSWRTILIRLDAAHRIGIRGAEYGETATVGWDRRIGALVETGTGCARCPRCS